MFGNLKQICGQSVTNHLKQINYVMVWNRKKQQTPSLNAVVQFGHYTMNFSAFSLVKRPQKWGFYGATEFTQPPLT